MKIISFNINGLRARLHQLQAIIDKHQPDIIGLQEIKVHNDAFPVEAVEAMGYHVYFHGQKAHYGVAMLCKKEANVVKMGFSSDTEDSQKRMVMVETTNEQLLISASIMSGAICAQPLNTDSVCYVD